MKISKYNTEDGVLVLDIVTEMAKKGLKELDGSELYRLDSLFWEHYRIGTYKELKRSQRLLYLNILRLAKLKSSSAFEGYCYRNEIHNFFIDLCENIRGIAKTLLNDLEVTPTPGLHLPTIKPNDTISLNAIQANTDGSFTVILFNKKIDRASTYKLENLENLTDDKYVSDLIHKSLEGTLKDLEEFPPEIREDREARILNFILTSDLIIDV